MEEKNVTERPEGNKYKIVLEEKDYPFLINQELQIRVFLNSKNFCKWTLNDYSVLFSHYKSLFYECDKIDLKFFEKSYLSTFQALIYLNQKIEKDNANLIKMQNLFQEYKNDKNFQESFGEKIKDNIEKLQNKIENQENSYEVLSSLHTNIENKFSSSIFEIANKDNFEEAMVNLLLEQNNFCLSSVAQKSFYIAYQDQFHRLDESTIKFLVNRKDNGIEYLLTNLNKVSADLFSYITKNPNVDQSLKNHFASSVEIDNVDEDFIVNSVCQKEYDPDILTALCYSKNLSSIKASELFFSSNATTAQKIALLSKNWPDRKEHLFELAQMFQFENYSKLSESEVDSLIQAVWISIGRFNGIKTPICNFKKEGPHMALWGSWLKDLQKSKSIESINAHGYFEIYLNNFNSYKQNKGYEILFSVIHEMVHSNQTKNEYEKNIKLKDGNYAAVNSISKMLLNFVQPIYFAGTSPLFVAEYCRLVEKTGDPYFFAKKDFVPEDYFEDASVYSQFVSTYKKVDIATLSMHMAVAKDILESIIHEKLIDVYNALSETPTSNFIYLNFTNELDARWGAISFIEETIDVYKEKGYSTASLKNIYKRYIEEENINAAYGKNLESSILLIAIELAKKGYIKIDNKNVENEVLNYIKQLNSNNENDISKEATAVLSKDDKKNERRSEREASL
ncbi:MAG: hypothetical protein WCR30_03520 [Clostridia bacterium]